MNIKKNIKGKIWNSVFSICQTKYETPVIFHASKSTNNENVINFFIHSIVCEIWDEIDNIMDEFKFKVLDELEELNVCT